MSSLLSAVSGVDLMLSWCCVQNAKVFSYTGACAAKRLTTPGLVPRSDSDDNAATPLIPAAPHLHAFKSPLLCEEHKFNLHRATLLHITLPSRRTHAYLRTLSRSERHTHTQRFCLLMIERLQCRNTVCKSPLIRFEVVDEETNSCLLKLL